jgi:hypothetical protein
MAAPSLSIHLEPRRSHGADCLNLIDHILERLPATGISFGYTLGGTGLGCSHARARCTAVKKMHVASKCRTERWYFIQV